MPVIRKPTSAGRFYPRRKMEILKTIKDNFTNEEYGPGSNLTVGSKSGDVPREVIGGVCPHAGYDYSGSAVAFTIQEIFKEGAPDTIIILGTQHTGYHEMGLMKEGIWETPLGHLHIDTEFASTILSESKILKEDDSAFNGYPHSREHCIEIQLPFIQYGAVIAQKEIKIVPIKIWNMNPDILEEVGKDIARAIKKTPNKDIAIFASLDMTHFSPKDPIHPSDEIYNVQHKLDNDVIEAFEAFDWKKTFGKAKLTNNCGPQCLATLMIIGKELGYTKAKKLQYYTSYEKLGKGRPCDYSVGYFSGVIFK